MNARTHLIVGGFPPGASAGHDMDYARRSLLEWIGEREDVTTTVANDFSDLDRWLNGTKLLMTYVAGPIPSADQHDVLRTWLEDGGRWFALHGTSGGRAARIEGTRQRSMVREAHHETLGCFFLNHPPVRRFEVQVTNGHPLTRGLPTSFETIDELYLVEPIGESRVLPDHGTARRPLAARIRLPVRRRYVPVARRQDPGAGLRQGDRRRQRGVRRTGPHPLPTLELAAVRRQDGDPGRCHTTDFAGRLGDGRVPHAGTQRDLLGRGIARGARMAGTERQVRE